MVLNKEQIKMIDVIQSNYKRLYFECDRQIGSTTLILSYAIHKALHERKKILFVCPNQNSIDFTYRKCFKVQLHINFRSTKKNVYFNGNGIIQFISYGDINNIRGHQYDFVIFDNAEPNNARYDGFMRNYHFMTECLSRMNNDGKFIILKSGVENFEIAGFTKYVIKKIKKINLWIKKN